MKSVEPPKPAGPSLVVTTSVQDAAGRRERDIDAAFAKRIAGDSADRIRKKTAELMKARGLKPEVPDIVAKTSVVEKSGRRFALIAMELDGRSRAVEVVGIDGGQLRRVFCFRDSTDAIALDDGDCGRRIAEVFKVRVGS